MYRRSVLLRLIVAAVVLLHAILLWHRLGDRSIVRPEVAIRWIAAAAVLGAAVLLRRASRGPRAWVVFWLVVALIHLAGPAGAVWTEAVLAAAPLLLLFFAATIALVGSNASPLGAGDESHVRTGVRSCVRNRAPPSR